jgi:hypothetical protein
MRVSHTVNQQGGNTQYVFSEARVHRESTEYLGVDKAVVSKRVGYAKTRRVYAAAPAIAPKVGMRGARGGVIEYVKDVTDQYMNKWVDKLEGPGKAFIGNESDSRIYLSNVKDEKLLYYHAYFIRERHDRRIVRHVNIPMEEAVRPPWTWDGWTNQRIGETYMQFFGTNSITDVDGFTAGVDPDDVVGGDVYAALAEVKEGRAASNKSPNEIKKTDNDYVTTAGKKVAAGAVLALADEQTVENAVDFLVRMYSFVRYNNMDVGEFLKMYTWRPVATMIDIMGTSDLVISETSPGVYEATQGVEGFHSRAFSDEGDLFGLVDKQVKRVLGLSRNKRHAAAKRLDVRAIRRAAVREYVEELSGSKGLLG